MDKTVVTKTVVNKTKLLSFVALALALAVAGCGSKEETPASREAESRPAAPAAAVDTANAATLTGKVSFGGAKPAARPIRMDAEPACKGLHSGPVHSEEAVVNDNGTLQYALVYVKDGLGDKAFPTEKEPVVLDQKGCIYKPHVVSVMTDQEIHILNSDPTTHNIHPLPKANREWNESQPPKSDKLVKTFPREEVTIPVKCNVHPWMKSYIGVFKHPYHAVTSADGTYTIKNLPPGEYTIAVWTEKFGTQEQKVSVAAKDSKTVDFTVKGS